MIPATAVITAIMEQAERQLGRAEDFNDDDVAAFTCILSDLLSLDDYLMDDPETMTRKIHEACQEARGIAWDECHKIYVLMDDEQVSLMRTYEYPTIITAEQATPGIMELYLQDWYKRSCSLKFVSAVRTVDGDPGEGFTDLVPQCQEWL